MLVVSDSSTLILLAKSDLVDAALDYFDGISIPETVEKEVVEDGLEQGFQDALLVRERIRQGRITVAGTPTGSAALQKEYGLHAGEAEALALYLESKADLLGMDDGKAIKVCRILQARFFTALSLAIHLTLEKAIGKIEGTACIQALGKHGRYTEEEIELALSEIGGARR